jgi:hypothetical protein
MDRERTMPRSGLTIAAGQRYLEHLEHVLEGKPR